MQQTLKIANWNLQRVLPGEPRLSRIQQHLSSLTSDIWFFTETHEGITPNSSFYGVASGEPDRPSQPGECLAAIWCRWPLEPLDDFVSDKARCVAARTVDAPFGEILLYGTVLPWDNPWQGIPAAGGQAYEAAIKVQSDDWLRPKETFPNSSLIVAGDFNQDLAASHYYGSRMKRASLETALERAGLKSLTSGSDDPIARKSRPYACIDHICISTNRGWDSLGAHRWPDTAVPIGNVSDHFGVSVDVIQGK